MRNRNGSILFSLIMLLIFSTKLYSQIHNESAYNLTKKHPLEINHKDSELHKDTQNHTNSTIIQGEYIIIDLGLPDESYEWVNLKDINNNGVVVAHGIKYNASMEIVYFPLLWDPVSGWSELETPEGTIHAIANTINDNGQIAGSIAINEHWFPCFWDEEGIHLLELLPGKYGGESFNNNDLGQIVGGNWAPSIPWVHSENTLTALEIPDDNLIGGTYAQSINNLNEILLQGMGDHWTKRSGYLYTQNEIAKIQNPDGNIVSVAALNDNGQVVGFANTYGWSWYPHYAFLWDRESGMINLGTLGGAYSQAEDINNNGTVAGYGSTSGYWPPKAFIWT
ncbi:hypothetical protein ACFLS9_01750, partial [Bacteroidota bacterium]